MHNYNTLIFSKKLVINYFKLQINKYNLIVKQLFIRRIFMKFFKNFIILALISFTALVFNSRAYAYGDYGLSCTNNAYGTSVD